MAFKRSLSISPKINGSNCSSKLNSCKVCSDQAHIKFYGALSCQSCKTFFRRNGYRPEIVRPCQYDGQCIVNMKTRHVCTACRLRKCFSVGMCTTLIRKEDHYGKKKSVSIKSNQTRVLGCKTMMSVSQLPTLDLLRNDRSSLTTSQWTLISNVLHAHDIFSTIPKLNQILKNLSLLLNEVRFDVKDALETVGCVYTSMELFVSSIPDFQVLNANEQRSLFQRNLRGIGSFYGSLVCRDTNFLENPSCFQNYVIVYGSETMKQSNRLIKRLDLDSTLIKLMLIVITFSSNCFIVDIHENMHNDTLIFGTFRLFGSQNVYVELLWKYMIYRYGYDETVLRFSLLVKQLLDKMNHAATVYIHQKIHHDFVDNFVEKSKEKLIISQNKPMVLWGKDKDLTNH